MEVLLKNVLIVFFFFIIKYLIFFKCILVLGICFYNNMWLYMYCNNNVENVGLFGSLIKEK